MRATDRSVHRQLTDLTFRRMQGEAWTVHGIHRKDEGTTGTDDNFFARSFTNVGALIVGRNMFGPVRGPWPDST